MNHWKDRLSKHPSQTALKDLEAALAGARSIAESDISTLEQWDRIDIIARFARNKFEAAIPELVSYPHLENISKAFSSAVSDINAYSENKIIKHLLNANATLDHVVADIRLTPEPNTVSDISLLRDQALSYNEYVQGQLQNFADQVKIIQDLKSVAETELKNLPTTVAERIKDFGNDYKTWHADEISKFDNYSKEIKSKIEEALEQIETHQSKVEKVVGIIGATGLSAGYKKAAFWGNITSWIWASIAIGSIGLLIYAVVTHVFPNLDKPVEWTTVVRQLLSSTPFILLAGFAALQVAHHQRTELRNKRSALELAAIDLYIAPLEQDERNEVRRFLVDKFFGQQENEPQKTESKRLLALATELVKILKPLNELAKK